jgi:hypothetical protein
MDEGLAWARELRRGLKADWAELWRDKRDDEVRAEGFSVRDFERLYVERGEVVVATRDFKPLSFGEILERHLGSDYAGRVAPDPGVGGWEKFARTFFPSKRVKRERPGVKVDPSQPQRKGGVGWLNMIRVSRKIRLDG